MEMKRSYGCPDYVLCCVEIFFFFTFCYNKSDISKEKKKQEVLDNVPSVPTVLL